MNIIINYLTIFILLLLASTIKAKVKIFDVTKYGAKPSAKTVINEALMKAWKEGCDYPGTEQRKILVPNNTWALKEIDLMGPCKGPMILGLEGTFLAPAEPGENYGDSWVRFQKIDRLRVYGGGWLDGQGKIAWTRNYCQKNPNCKNLPMNMRLDYVNNSIIQGLHSLNSKNFHINLLECHNVTLKSLTITAPDDSPNTDGIHIGRSSGINILDTRIQTGDDCISIGDGSSQIKITGVSCGPGHGISIGSLGKYKDELPVTGVYVSKCNFSNTQNGVRIKTWPGKYASTASDMHFEDITMNNVDNPIIIDQMYCPSGHCNQQSSSNVKLSKISFKGIRGTSNFPEAVKLICSNSIPCEDVEIGDVNLTYKGGKGPAVSNCVNVKPKITGKLQPAGCKS